PIITKVLSLPWGFTSPFRAEVYFINMKVFTTMKWGTKDPVVFKDSELGMVRLRAFGNFTTRNHIEAISLAPIFRERYLS
ncbi:MAG: SPFH domain-containing protein, partial [Deltaproteobacteria bacterium]|nr:SPFH domain-containing protein [Deltaproteobacteria bacterium]